MTRIRSKLDWSIGQDSSWNRIRPLGGRTGQISNIPIFCDVWEMRTMSGCEKRGHSPLEA
jgi:hypothetical protein